MAIHAFSDFLLPEVQRKLALCFEYFALVGLRIDQAGNYTIYNMAIPIRKAPRRT